jgi:hypothetical protein
MTDERPKFVVVVVSRVDAISAALGTESAAAAIWVAMRRNSRGAR